MAYLKYKELTKYFYFYKRLDIDSLPKYVTDYLEKGEHPIAAFATRRDKGIFTEKKIILFDCKGFSTTKQIHTVPYTSISTIAVLFRNVTAEILIYLDSGYPLNLKFTNLKADDKTFLRELYSKVSEKVCNKSK